MTTAVSTEQGIVIRRRGRAPRRSWETFAQARDAKGHTQAEAAAACAVSQQTLSEWETLTLAPVRKHWQTLATYLGMTVPEVASDIALFFAAE